MSASHTSLYHALLKALDAIVRQQVTEEVTAAMTTYRRSFIRQTEAWCCAPMKRFAKQTWGLDRPCGTSDETSFGVTSLHLRGTANSTEPVIYCPFCGVRL